MFHYLESYNRTINLQQIHYVQWDEEEKEEVAYIFFVSGSALTITDKQTIQNLRAKIETIEAARNA